MLSESQGLLKADWDRVFKAILLAKFNPEEFSRDEVVSLQLLNENGGRTRVSRLTHIPSGFSYIFDFTPYENAFAICTPGRNGLREQAAEVMYPSDAGRGFSYGTHIDGVLEWLKEMAKQRDSPDFWEQIGQLNAKYSSATAETEDRQFTPDELDEVRKRLSEFEGRISTLDERNRPLATFIKAEIRFLVERAPTEKKRCWFKLAVGTFVGIYFALQSYNELREFWPVVQWAITGLTGHDVPRLP